ncbi:helix-turn-helix domain-containing protein [Brevibacterium sp. 91QC2O2]|uniref:helix-turn-helix domain-containing protein n=1 Tax=Brevibacterium sp. 91QC2O2 TaxID=2968458 RepID=UPI00211C8D36|nr:helix-turn-helix domain-containing protein [Brevibacterium sp. 91QC2O2]MCQ9367318.1 helix-turn-helix domain-containing protein [Brevibacterium sp. 91QC2O2]
MVSKTDETTKPEALSVNDAAEILGLSAYTCRELIHEGHIRAVRIGKRAIRVPRTEIDRLLTDYMPSAKDWA